MMNLTMMQLGAAFLWGLLAVCPLFVSALFGAAAESDEDRAIHFILLLGFALQTAFGVACYMAGGVR